MTDLSHAQTPLTTRRHLLIFAGIFIIGGFLRFSQITDSSLWMDEIWSIEMAMGHASLHDHLPPNIVQTQQIPLTSLKNAAPWWQIWTHLAGVTHPPLYFVVLRWWMDLFGTSPLAVRSLSTVFSLVALALFFDVCWMIHGPRIALLGAGMMALSIGQLDFAQEARGYPMLLALALSSADLILRIQRQGPSYRLCTLLAVSLAAAALTHYFAVGILLALLFYAMLRLRGRARRITLASFVGGGVIAAILWLPVFFSQLHSLPSLTPTFLREAQSEHHLHNTLYLLIGLPGEFLLGESLAESSPSALLLSLAILVLIVPVVRLYWRRDLLLWVLWTLGSIGFVATLDLLHQSTLIGYPRYTFLMTPALFALLAGFGWPRQAFLRDILPLAIFAILCFAIIQRLRDGVPSKQDWRDLSAKLNQYADPDDLLVFYNPDPWVTPGTWYMNFMYYTPGSHHPWLILNHRADPQLLQALQSRDSLWVLGRFPDLDGPRLLPGFVPLSLVKTATAGAACHLVRAHSLKP